LIRRKLNGWFEALPFLLNHDPKALGEMNGLSDVQADAFHFGIPQIHFIHACAAQVGVLKLCMNKRRLVE
jgi:hypothetical protein